MDRAKASKGAAKHDGGCQSCQPEPNRVDHHSDDDANQNDHAHNSIVNSDFNICTGAIRFRIHNITP